MDHLGIRHFFFVGYCIGEGPGRGEVLKI